MDIKFVTVIFLALICLLMISACRTAEITFYEHEQSDRFFRDLDFDAVTNGPFKDGRLLLVASAKETHRDDYIIWFGAYSEYADQVLVIEEAMISGEGWDEARKLNERVTVDDEVPGQAMFKKGFKLFVVNSEVLEKATANDTDLSLGVIYSIDGVSNSINFVLKRRVEKHTVFPT